jgi:hypothetical protein
VRDGYDGRTTGTANVRYDLVFVCELELGREIIERLFFLLSTGETARKARGSVLTVSASSLSSIPRRRVFSFENVLMRCWSSAGGESP